MSKGSQPINASIGSEQNTLISVTTSGRVQARQIDGQRFSVTLAYPPMSRSEFAPIKVFCSEPILAFLGWGDVGNCPLILY